MTKRGFVQVRVSEGEKRAFGAAAAAAGLSVSEWLRRVCLRAAGEGLPLVSSGEWRESALSKMSRAQIELLKENDAEQPRSASYSERFVVPASCPAPNTKKSFRPDFK